MTIQVGDSIPSMNVQLVTNGPNEVSTDDIFGGKKGLYQITTPNSLYLLSQLP